MARTPKTKLLPVTRAAILAIVALVGVLLVPPPAMAASAASCGEPAASELGAPYAFRYGLSAAELESEFLASTGYRGRGYRPVRLTGYLSGGQQQFTTKWVQRSGPAWVARYNLTSDQFHDLFLQLRGTHRPVDVSGYATPSGDVRFAVIWEQNVDGVEWAVHRNTTRDGMQAYVDQYSQTGWTPLRVEGYQRSGTLNYVSVWEHEPCTWAMHNKMTRDDYNTRLAQYTDRQLVHVDAFVDGGQVYYAGIWWARPGARPEVRTNRDWYLFQREFNDASCDGQELSNAYAAEVPGGVRYGGIWSAVPPRPRTTLAARVQQEVNCSPGRGGAAVLNLTTGAQVLEHADAQYGTSSTIKSLILYTLLRRVDADSAVTLSTTLDSGAQFGSNPGTGNVTAACNTSAGATMLQANTRYSLSCLARLMIDVSHNWATNRLIQWLTPNTINAAATALGLGQIRLQRYMTGDGVPSLHGNSTEGEDYLDGWDNFATPRQFAQFLQRVHQNGGLLTTASHTFFWNMLDLNEGAHDAVLDAGVGTDWRTVATLAEKAGSNSWGSAPAHRPQLAGAHRQRSAAGRLLFADGQVVFYAVFVDEGDPGSETAMENTRSCVVMHAVRQFGGQTTGTDVPACRGD
jgi:hypothetical protein